MREVSDAIDRSDIVSGFDEVLDQYNRENPVKGYLRFQITTAQETIPIPNAMVTVSKCIGDNYFVSRILHSDENGKTDNLELPAPSGQLSQRPGDERPYSLYDVRVVADRYKTVDVYAIPVFEGITSIQSIQMNLALKLEDRLEVELSTGYNAYEL